MRGTTLLQPAAATSRPGPLAYQLRRRPDGAARLALLAVAAWPLACGSGDPLPEGDALAGGERSTACPWDDDDTFGTATPLALGSAAEGYLCPRADQDWYSFTVPAGSDLVTVRLSLEGPVAPINPTYTLWTAGAAAIAAGPLPSESATPGADLLVTHRLAAGSYLLAVRDQGNDSEDTRHPYALTVSAATDPDGHEPNDTFAQATASAATQSGYIASRADRDVYAISVAQRGIVTLRLTMPAGGIQPRLRLLDGSSGVRYDGSNPAGTLAATDLFQVQAVAEAGTYYAVVSDLQERFSDAATPYTLTLASALDPDSAEPNDTPAAASALGALACGAAWSGWLEHGGYLGSTGDVDWLQLDLSACGRGVLELELSFANPATLPPDLHPALRLVRAVAGEACTLDQQCQELSRPCDHVLDCAYLGNTCLGTGTCAGSGLCLPTATCGATLLSLQGTVSAPALHAALPLVNLSRLWLAVADVGADSYSLEQPYTLRVRARSEPDSHEPNDTYTAGPPTESAAWAHTPLAASVPVHDCSAGSDCCGPSTWVEGYVATSFDQDWYRYPHPCPGTDCMVAVHYDFDPGPVDFYVRIFQGNSAWYDNLTSTVDSGTRPAQSGVFGGLAAGDECLYGWQGHGGSYYLTVRDTVYVSSGQPLGGTWDFSDTQAYRFCIEKLADGCYEPPCIDYPVGGCSAP